jgi:hypothetical protein
MKAKYIFGIIALSIGLTACENYFDEKYMGNGDPQISVVKTYDYTLTAADYKTIADNKTNKAYAASLDTLEGQTTNQDALALVGVLTCFNDVASADMYVPAFIYSKYPHLDPGSIFNVTYQVDEGQPAYLNFYNQTIQYTLRAVDYKDVWGVEGISYLTPATEAKVADYLPQVDDNYLCGVKYAFSSKEPGAGGEAEYEKEVIYIYRDGLVWEPYESAEYKVVVPPDEANGMTVKWLTNTFPYAETDQVVVVMEYNAALKHYEATEYTFDGTTWVANNGIVEETMSFALSSGWAANLSTYYKQAIAGDGNQGKILVQDFNLEDGITYIWKFDNSYGMKGTAYKSGPHYGEGWFVTPKIKLKNAVSPALSFDQAMNYGPDIKDGRLEQATVWVSTDFAGDVTTASWTQLPWNEFDGTTGFPDANSWTFYNSGRMDLSAWNNRTIYIGFRYKSEPGQTCSTWEVKNILVNEPEEEE